MNKVASKITEHLLLMDVIDQKDAAIYCYGLEVLLLSLLEIISILCLALLVGNFFETLFYFAAFIPLRLFAGGYHASTRLRCYLLSLFVYGIFSWLLMVFPSEHRLMFSVVVAGFSVVMIFLFAPVIYPKSPLFIFLSQILSAGDFLYQLRRESVNYGRFRHSDAKNGII